MARKVRVKGTVQGVGFRPYIFELARENGLCGHVLNDSLGVHCLVVGSLTAVDGFVAEIRPRAPRLATVEHVIVEDVALPSPVPEHFRIEQSQSLERRQAWIPVDTHACSDCLREMRDPDDRRFGYPFINCTNCGPRYSIITDLPYDRSFTSMSAFSMCARCRLEYEDPTNRRFHAQPNACQDCGPTLTGFDSITQAEVTGADALAETARRLKRAEVVAIKSVGGFHLAVDAESSVAVEGLRKRKLRDWKPFAVMARDLEAACRIGQLTAAEQAILASPQRPILLACKAAGADLLADSVAPRNPSIGVMLPSAPHHELLFDFLDIDFVVMTSGNISGHPIETTNAGARENLGKLADFILAHDRAIVNRLDDSVIRYTEMAGHEPFMTYIRRGRGYAPYYLESPYGGHGQMLGTGSELKAASALSDGTTIFGSQHVGDMTNDAVSRAHEDATSRIQSLYAISPSMVLGDMHPTFLERAQHLYGATEAVQHHHAHMSSCLLDHALPEGQYIGLVLDGVGYGADASMWGAEFFIGGYCDVTRVTSLRTIPLVGGDAAVRQPSRIAFALAQQSGALAELTRTQITGLLGLTDEESRVFGVMLQRSINTSQVSSMGRLFDGVAALAGFARRAEYEAQGPIEFEGILNRDNTWDHQYPEMDRQLAGEPGPAADTSDVTRLDWRPLVRAVVGDLANEVSLEKVSRRFHSAVAVSLATEAVTLSQRFPTDGVVLSGGVFLNEFLSLHVPRLLKDQGITVYRHERIPTNDAGIAVGQVVVGQARFESRA